MNPAPEYFECIAVAFEIGAFFCVTLDLYGEERLSRATVRLSSAMDSISAKILQRLWEPFKKVYQEVAKVFGAAGEAPPEPVFIVLALMLVAAFLRLSIFLLDKITNRHAGFFEYTIIAAILVALIVIGFLAAGYALMAFLISLRRLMLLGLYVLGKVKVQGILLGAGTVLFLISKGMIMWHSVATLRHK